MNKLSMMLLALGISLSSVTLFAANTDLGNTAQQIHKESVCQEGKCPGLTEQEVSNKKIRGKDPLTAEQDHKKFICKDGKCPGKTERDIGSKKIIGQDTLSAEQHHKATVCQEGKCPGKIEADAGKK